MIELIKELRDKQAAAGRKIANYARSKRYDPSRLSRLQSVVGAPLPKELVCLYERYDGAEPPQTMWQELGYFFGHYISFSSRGLEIVNQVSRTRDTFPLSDEISFARDRKAGSLNVVPIGDHSLIAATISTRSDVRYPAFDSIKSMLQTYIEALDERVWTFAEDGKSLFDNVGFLKIAERHNRFPVYWEKLVSDELDFKIAQLEQGKIRPRTKPKSGQELLIESGYEDVVRSVG